MAEVLATFAALSSFLQIVDFASKVGSHAHSLLREQELQANDVKEAARVAWGFETIWSGPAVDPHSRNVPAAPANVDSNVQKLKDSCESEVKSLVDALNSLQINSKYATNSNGVTSKSPMRLYHTVRIALKSPSTRRMIEQKRRHLQELNGLLSTALLRKLVSMHENQITNTLDVIKRKDQEIGIKLDAQSDAEKVRRLAKEHSNGLRKVYQHIMASLQYESMNTRWQNIPDTYPRTYRWAVQSHEGLRSWLREENGIFWITGKAGSGKSTLMKFIAESPDCLSLLRQWSGGNDLIVPSYFFWYAGTYLQKSIQGLLQNILLQILRDCPDLCQVAFADHYTSIIPPDDLPPISYDQLLKAFDAVSREETHSAQQRSKRFCLFIDGLDEYHGNPLELIQLLVKLAKNPCIKLCVSSRPWNAFRAAFESSRPNLRLEDLSSEDIRFYIQGSLQQYGMPSDDDEFSALVEEITVKAEGVFLWVFLVVKSLLSGFAEQEPVWMLRKRVEEFPQDLEEFFDNILKRVDAVYKEHTNQALKLAFMTVRSPENNLEASWVDFFFMRQLTNGLQDASFATSLRAQYKTPEQWRQMRYATRSFLSASCKDLLWLPYPNSTSRDGSVEFLHRTVYDYLNSELMQQTMDQRVPQIFLDRRIFHLLRLARQTLMHPGEQKTRLKALKLLHAKSILRPHVDRTEAFMQTFQSILLQHKPRDPDDELMPEALPSLIAYGLQEYLAMFREEELRSSFGYVRAISTLNPEGLFRAAFGRNEMKPFPLSQVKISLLNILLELREIRKVPSNVRWGYSTFLNLWADNEPFTDRSFLRHLWDIAKLFLCHGGILRDVMIDLRSGSETDASFFRLRVPLDWLREAEQPRLLPDRIKTLIEYSTATSNDAVQAESREDIRKPPQRSRSLDTGVRTSLFGASASTESNGLKRAACEASTEFGFATKLFHDSMSGE